MQPAPKYLILPTHHLIRGLREKLAQLSVVEYDLTIIGQNVMAALSYQARLTEERQRMLQTAMAPFTSAFDRLIITEVLGEFFDNMNWLIQRLGLRDERGATNYLFDRWHGDDMIVHHLPY